MSLVILKNQSESIPTYEIIKNDDITTLRIVVADLKPKNINVYTSGVLLFVSGKNQNNNKDQRCGGSLLCPEFEMEFIVDTSAKIGAPYISHGVLNVPIAFDEVVPVSVRGYSVRELTTTEEKAIIQNTSAVWIYDEIHG